MWKEGSSNVESDIYHYQAKVYDTPSPCGINRGCISKLSVRLNGQAVIGYDRGWYKRPATQAEKAALWIILDSFN